MEWLIYSLVMGVVATIAIDGWAILLKKGFGLPTTNWAMVGRWFGHLPNGVFVHRPITESKVVPHELLIGWVAHYVIGIFYAAMYLYVIQILLSTTPSFGSAFLFGLATVVVPFLVLQPGLGMGLFARHAPRPNVARLMSLSIHSIFGASLYLGWLISSL